MKLSECFKFLKLESVRRKNANELPPSEQYFSIIQLIDSDNCPVKFMCFDNEISSSVVKDINNGALVPYQDVLVDFELNSNEKGWSVKLIRILSKF